MLQRAEEHAKRGGDGPKHILWVTAQDAPHNLKDVGSTPEHVERKRARFLQFHDQKTAGIPRLLPLYENIAVRVSEKIAKRHEDDHSEAQSLQSREMVFAPWRSMPD